MGGRRLPCGLLAPHNCILYMQIRDLLPGCVLGVSAYVQGETKDAELLGSAVMSLFSKKGRLKTSLQRLQLCQGVQPDLRWPSRTPGKVPVAERGRMGELEQKLKQFERMDMPEMPRCSWLDHKTLGAIQNLQASLAPVRAAPAYVPCLRALHDNCVCT